VANSSLRRFAVAPLDPAAPVAAGAPFRALSLVRPATAFPTGRLFLLTALGAGAAIHGAAAIRITPAVGALAALGRGLGGLAHDAET
jgi:hypothetical protein